MRSTSPLLLLCCLLAFSRASAEVVVTTIPLSAVFLHPETSAPAATVAINDSLISAEIGAIIDAVEARVGDPVAVGDVLVRLRCGDFERALRRSEAELEALRAQESLARYQAERALALSRSQTVSEEVLKQRVTEADVLGAKRRAQEVATAQAREDVGRCTVRAPFTGVVVERRAAVGELSAPGHRLLRIVAVDEVEVFAFIQSDDVTDLEAAETVFFTAQGERYPLLIRALSPVLDPRSRSREVRLRFSDSRALPGSSGRLVWLRALPHVPAEYITKRGGAYGVFLAEEGRARFHPLAGAEEGRPAEADLPGETALIVRGRFALQDGDAIRVE